MIYDICAHTDRGVTRSTNEDSVVFDAKTQICILADGMGGYNAGEVASEMATTFIKVEMSRWLSLAGPHAGAKEVRRALEICVDNANRAIYHAGKANPQYAGMGTTLVVGVFRGAHLTLAHVGDSRCYRLRGKRFEQITKDHSFLQEQIDAGLITHEQALTSVNRNLVTRAMGVEGFVVPEIHEHHVEPEDVYLMCSDGLSDMVGDAMLETVLRQAGSLEHKAQAFIHEANACGGRDNISVLLAQAKGKHVVKRSGLFAKLSYFPQLAP